MASTTLPCTVVQLTTDISKATEQFDGILLVCHDFNATKAALPRYIVAPIEEAEKIDDGLHVEGAVLGINLSCRRIVYAPVGEYNIDFDDVRSFTEAAKSGIQRALKAGLKKPLLILPNCGVKNSDVSMLLGALEALYVPLQVRDDPKAKKQKVEMLFVWGPNVGHVRDVVHFALAVEEGRFVARDIGGGDPERMAPPKVAAYIQQLFKDTSISTYILNDQEALEKQYPLFGAVNRAASVIERHHGCMVRLEYRGEGKADKSLLLVGKGVTYDTGGADIKAGGVMAGMSRDKCGAAAIAGFFQTLSRLKPRGIIAKASLGLVRNSVGENCYVADEIIVSRHGVRVRVGNTDAEGRMVMADLLCEMKEGADLLPDPHLMTIATLTGHAVLSVGLGYSIVMDNSVARKEKHDRLLEDASLEIGEPFEISTIRREDLAFHKGKCESEDVVQCNNLPSSRTPRGHQTPAAFLMLASGLDKNGLNSELPLKYSHLDIAASAGDLPHEPTGAPILGLVYHHLKGRYQLPDGGPI